MYAVISSGGKQYKVENNSVIEIDRVFGNLGEKIVFDKVLAIGELSNIKIGTPFVSDASVSGEVISHFRGPKLIAFKMKRRKGYKKTKGHRQELTKVRITNIA